MGFIQKNVPPPAIIVVSKIYDFFFMLVGNQIRTIIKNGNLVFGKRQGVFALHAFVISQIFKIYLCVKIKAVKFLNMIFELVQKVITVRQKENIPRQQFFFG